MGQGRCCRKLGFCAVGEEEERDLVPIVWDMKEEDMLRGGCHTGHKAGN